MIRYFLISAVLKFIYFSSGSESDFLYLVFWFESIDSMINFIRTDQRIQAEDN